VRDILKGVPVRLIAVKHDTSVNMIERTYSRYLAAPGDTLLRRAMLDTDVPVTTDNIRRLPGRRSQQ
jgi:hypothetical protein